MFLTHKINPKVFCPNFGVHFTLTPVYFISPFQGCYVGIGSKESGIEYTNVWIKYIAWAYYNQKQIANVCTIHLIINPPPYFWVGKYREENVKKFRLFERSEFLNFSFLNDKFSVKLRNTAAAFFSFANFALARVNSNTFDLPLA